MCQVRNPRLSRKAGPLSNSAAVPDANFSARTSVWSMRLMIIVDFVDQQCNNIGDSVGDTGPFLCPTGGQNTPWCARAKRSFGPFPAFRSSNATKGVPLECFTQRLDDLSRRLKWLIKLLMNGDRKKATWRK